MRLRALVCASFSACFALHTAPAAVAADHALFGWNDLGMHCMDSDYSVFSILPPFNTIHAQLISSGRLVTDASGLTVTYEAVADPDGSFNSTSDGKTAFWQFADVLYGADLPVNHGLGGYAVPGISNAPQAMGFTAQPAWFSAEGIPLTPYDDALQKNFYPLLKLAAKNAQNQTVASTEIVAPVSDEMDCRLCHASGAGPAARPHAGWVWDMNPERDYRLNILRLHDEHRDPSTYPGILSSNRYNPEGLYRTVTADGHPILCARCHGSNALPGTGYGSLPPLTAAIHGLHAGVSDPLTGLSLNNQANRQTCYRCHPGSTTRCLRGVMGDSIAADGSRAIQCQSCHGAMSAVGAQDRMGWLEEPLCQSCHPGNAVATSGLIRYTTVFTPQGEVRQPVDLTFATQPNAPAAGLSLYRFSTGHGGLMCEACHGSPHAEFPAHRNDNLTSIAHQGHAGVISECTACHTSTPGTVTGGPHGLHPLGQSWVSQHADVAEDGGASACAVCHGTDYRGTVLSRSQADRQLSAFGTKTFWRGFQIGCYTCHNGPNSEHSNPNAPALVSNASANTTSGQAVDLTLPANDANGDALALRIVSQPAHGTAGLSNRMATYFPEPGFVGTDTFTFAAWDGSTDSNLGTGTVVVAQGPFSISGQALVPPSAPTGWPVPFGLWTTPSNVQAVVSCDWDFGDDSTHGTNQYSNHAFTSPGTYAWTAVATVRSGQMSASSTNAGTIVVGPPMEVKALLTPTELRIVWPRTILDGILEHSETLGPSAHWVPVTQELTVGPTTVTFAITRDVGYGFYRLRKP